MVQTYLKQCVQDFMKSFKSFSWNYILVAALHALMWFVIVAFFMLVLNVFRTQLGGLDLPPLTAQPTQETARAVQDILKVSAVSLGAALIGLAVLYGIFNALIWKIIAKKKVSFPRFIAGSLITIFFWFILFAIGSRVLKPMTMVIMMVIGFFLFVHFTNTYFIQLLNHPITKACKPVIKIGLVNLPSFIVPYVFAVIVFIVLVVLMNVLHAVIPPTNIELIINLAVLLIFFAWLRYYMYDLVKDMKQ